MASARSVPLLLIPAMMCDARLYGPQIAAISGLRSLHLAPITRFETIEELATDIIQQSPERFALAGLAMGGVVAMEILRQAPERVDRLALLDTNPRAELEEARLGRERQIERARAGKLTEVMAEELKPHYLAAGPRRKDVLQLCLTMALDLGADVFERQSRALQARPDQQNILMHCRKPTLILMGAEDKLYPRDRHALMNELVRGSMFEVVEGAGHLPTLEQPAAVNRALSAWLDM